MSNLCLIFAVFKRYKGVEQILTFENLENSKILCRFASERLNMMIDFVSEFN